ncbi:MAG: tripartite tricarboxylate transporter substrate binding protein [Burkholderiales bacterium]|nr:tripartite tricarboxylate transporter substrate binding protein [Burkholderiales bacterium]
MDRRSFSRLLMACLCAAGVSQAAAQGDWPTRPITLVVPLAPGSPTDIMARAIGAELQQRLGQAVVVENKPGGGSLIATSAVQNAKPDGYTYLFAISAHTINPATRRQARYDPIKDFTPVGLIGAVPHILVVGKHLPVNNLRELIALAKSKPDKLSYGSAGIGISNHLEGELFSNLIGVDLVHVPYKGGTTEARNDVLTGRVDMLFDLVSIVRPYLKDGRLKPIGVAQAKRSRLAPELPTLAESGLPAFDVMPWTGMLGPAGIDPAIVAKFSQALRDTLADQKIIDRLAGMGIETVGSTPQQFTEFLKRDLAIWTDVARKAKIELD